MTRRARFRNRSQTDGAQANVDVRAEQDRAKAAADDAAVFVPQCLACGYELTGLADGACPECGTEFSHKALRLARDERRSDQGFGMYLATPLAWMAIVLSIGCAGPLVVGRQATVGAAWALAAGMLFAMRSILFGSRMFTLVFVASAAAIVTVSFNPDAWSSRSAGYLFLNRLFGWSAALCAMALIRLKWRWTLWAWASLLIGMGIAVGVTGFVGVFRNEHWSRWPDVRAGNPYTQYPLLNAEAAWLGAAAIAVGLLVMLLVRRIEPFTMEDPQADRRAS
ncbi:MAG: hypothetical protein K2W85_13085 [Phycisphaerales bacterium]|nr:hypothetical protein [Phycisphaerales bacterium]